MTTAMYRHMILLFLQCFSSVHLTEANDTMSVSLTNNYTNAAEDYYLTIEVEISAGYRGDFELSKRNSTTNAVVYQKRIQDFYEPIRRSNTNYTKSFKGSQFEDWIVYKATLNVTEVDGTTFNMSRILTLFAKSSPKAVVPASGTKCCQKLTISRTGSWGNSLNFPSNEAGEESLSNEICSTSGRPVASVTCQKNTYGCSFDLGSVVAIKCNVSIESLLEKLKVVRGSPGRLITLTRKVHFLSRWAEKGSVNSSQANTFLSLISRLSVLTERTGLKISPEILQNLIKAHENLVQVSGKTNNTVNRSPKRSIWMNDRNWNFVKSIDKLCTGVKLKEAEVWKMQTTDWSIRIMEPTDRGLNSSCRDSKGDLIEEKDDGVSVFVPSCAVERAKEMVPVKVENQTVNVVVIVSKDPDVILSPETSDAVGKVISVQVGSKPLNDLEEPLWFQVELEPRRNNVIRYRRCGYFNVTQKKWAFNGCKLIAGTNPPKCTCTHMTNFAILVRSVPAAADMALDVVSKVGLMLSIAGLLLMILIYMSQRKIREQMSSQIHLHLCFNLLIAYITFLVGVKQTSFKNSCIAIAAIIHFSLLSSWGWMCVECHAMYRKFVSIYRLSGSHYVLYQSCIVYACALSITVLTLAISFGWSKIHPDDWDIDPETPVEEIPTIYLNDQQCWLTGVVYYIGFLAPVSVMFLLNFLAFFVILHAVTWGRVKLQSNLEKNTAKQYVIRGFTISLLLGISWIFALPIHLTNNEVALTVFSWIFTVTNSLQGFFIFVLFCVRPVEIRSIWWKPLRNFLCCSHKRRRSALESQIFALAPLESEVSSAANAPERSADVVLASKDNLGLDMDDYVDVRAMCKIPVRQRTTK